jgi:hypothetical protein
MANKEISQLLDRVASVPGWTVNLTHNQHLKIRGPNEALIFAASTPSDYRSVKNLRSRLKRHGFPAEHLN